MPTGAEGGDVACRAMPLDAVEPLRSVRRHRASGAVDV